MLVCTDDVLAFTQVSGLSDSDGSNDDLSCTLYKVGEIQSGSFFLFNILQFRYFESVIPRTYKQFPTTTAVGDGCGGK